MFSRTVISGIRVRLEAGRHSVCECSHYITNQGKAWKASAQCQLLRLAVEGFPSLRTACSVGICRCALEHFGRCCVFLQAAAR